MAPTPRVCSTLLKPGFSGVSAESLRWLIRIFPPRSCRTLIFLFSLLALPTWTHLSFPLDLRVSFCTSAAQDLVKDLRWTSRQIFGALCVAPSSLALALQVLGVQTSLNSDLCYLQLQDLCSLLGRYIPAQCLFFFFLPKKAVVNMDFISSTSLLSRTASLCCALQFLQMIVLYILLSFRVVYDGSGSNPVRPACRLLNLLLDHKRYIYPGFLGFESCLERTFLPRNG